MKKVKNIIEWILVNLPIFLLSLTCIFPVVWLIYSSLKSQQEFTLSTLALPKSPNLDNYVKAWVTAKFDTYMFNTTLNSLISLFMVLIISFVVGYLLSRYHFRGRGLVYAIFLSGTMLPVYSLIVPMFIQFNNIGMLNKRFTLWAPYICFELPIAIFLVDSYVKGISNEMEDAAAIDGAGLFRTMFQVIMPICRPVLSTVTILTFMHVWNEFPLAQILVSDQKFKTIPVGLTYFTTQYTVDYTLLMSALVMATVPILIIYLFFSKKVMEGMMAGAVKG